MAKKIKNRGMPEMVMLKVVEEKYKQIFGRDNEVHNGRQAMLEFWLSNPIRLGFGEDEGTWDTSLDKEAYIS